MMNSSNSATASSAAGRRRGLSSKQYSVEEQALDQIAKEVRLSLEHVDIGIDTEMPTLMDVAELCHIICQNLAI